MVRVTRNRYNQQSFNPKKSASHPRGQFEPAMTEPRMSDPVQQLPYEVIDFAEIQGVSCPCGIARRAFHNVEDFPGTIHVTEISNNARLHYHRRLTETYYFLECESGARMQLDDDVIGIKPGMCVMIRPGVRHRAIGKMKVLIVVFPKFDPQDEWFDDL